MRVKLEPEEQSSQPLPAGDPVTVDWFDEMQNRAGDKVKESADLNTTLSIKCERCGVVGCFSSGSSGRRCNACGFVVAVPNPSVTVTDIPVMTTEVDRMKQEGFSGQRTWDKNQ